MKTMKTIIPTPKPFIVVDEMICDLCGKKQKGEDWPPQHGNNVQEVDVHYKSGTSYPEGGYGTIISFDICPECFEEKLIPWLREQRATPTIEDWDF